MQLIIPTLWKPPGLVAALHHYLAAPSVERLILVDNAPEDRPAGVPQSGAKLLLLPQPRNIYVNPAWNLGAAQVEDPEALVLILNDDILLPEAVLTQLARHSWQPGDVLGLLPTETPASASTFRVEALTIDPHRSIGQQQPGFGSALLMQRATFRPIPEELQIWFGDDWLLRGAGRVFGFCDGAIEREHHLTMAPMRLSPIFRERLAADRAAARQLLGLG